MPSINQYPTANPLQLGDQIIVWSTNNSDSRKSTISDLTALVQSNITFPTASNVFTTQYAIPSATGFNVNISDTGSNVWLVLTPTAGYAAGTITLPPVASVVDKQEVLVNCTQQVTALTIDGNGAVAVTGEPVALGADDFFKLKYDIISQSWYRVG